MIFVRESPVGFIGYVCLDDYYSTTWFAGRPDSFTQQGWVLGFKDPWEAGLAAIRDLISWRSQWKENRERA